MIMNIKEVDIYCNRKIIQDKSLNPKITKDGIFYFELILMGLHIKSKPSTMLCDSCDLAEQVCDCKGFSCSLTHHMISQRESVNFEIQRNLNN